ncbi:MAG: hypothetical protein AB8B56_20140 [Crocinitomicaceae bacterium]
MSNTTIRLELTIDEANAILAGLGEQPYIKVADLIHKIKDQAASQLTSETITDTMETMEMDQIPVEDGQ